MRDYRRLEAYHSLDQLTVEVYQAVKHLAPTDFKTVGTQMQRVVCEAVAAIIHGCSTRNATTLLPYTERAHACTEELGQLLRLCKRLQILPEKTADFLLQRQRTAATQLLRLVHRTWLNAERCTGETEWDLSPDSSTDPVGATTPMPRKRVGGQSVC